MAPAARCLHSSISRHVNLRLLNSSLCQLPRAPPLCVPMQDGLEEIFVFLRIPQRKPYGSMESAVKKALAVTPMRPVS